MPAAELVKELIDAGIHFGHRVSRWNPKMQPYIFGKRNLIHIVNVKETLKGILLAKRFITQTVGQGKDVLFVGTKRQARKAVESHAQRTNMHSVTDRWLGGTLTNFREIRKRVGRLEELEKLEAEGMLDAYSKKEGAALRREMRKILRNLGGIRNMTKLPGALVIIDQKREDIAVKEARKMGIPVVCLLDTDSDPDKVDIPIPGNDDAMRAIELIIKQMADAVEEGIRGRAEMMQKEQVDQQMQQEEQSRRRSSRPTTTQKYEEADNAESGSEEPDAASEENQQLPASGGQE
ncbi:MAG: 30S ribosomal protein S2 [Phycisphaerae bacterium]